MSSHPERASPPSGVSSGVRACRPGKRTLASRAFLGPQLACARKRGSMWYCPGGPNRMGDHRLHSPDGSRPAHGVCLARMVCGQETKKHKITGQRKKQEKGGARGRGSSRGGGARSWSRPQQCWLCPAAAVVPALQ